MNVSKYPPSLMYVLVTLGVSLLLLPALESLRGPMQRVLLTFGRTALFTYVLHIYVVHGLAMLVGVLSGYPARAYVDFLGNPAPHIGQGFTLGVAYVAWLGTLVLLYPLSAWFEGVKRRRRDWWLSYL